MKKLTLLSLLLLAPFADADEKSAAPLNLLENGDFEKPMDGRKIPAWSGTEKANLVVREDEGNHILSLRNDDAEQSLSTRQIVKLDPAMVGKMLQFTGKMRVAVLQPGKKSWHTARVQLTWKDDAGKELSPWPTSPFQKKPTQGWVNFSESFAVPATATQLVVAPAIFNCIGGADFDELALVVVEEAPVQK